MSEFGHRKINVLELVSGLVPLLGSAQAEQLMGLFEKFKTKEISKAGFIRLMKFIAGDQNIQMVTRQFKSQGGIIRSVENARDQSALQSQVPYQLQNLPTPSVEMQENLIFLEPMQFAPHVPIPAHETVLDNLDSQTTADAFYQSALLSQVSMQQQNSATSFPVLPDLDGVQLFQLEQEWEPPALPTPSLNKLQPHMQCGHVLLPTYESAGGIQHHPDKLDSQSTANAFDQSALQSQVSMQQQNSATFPPVLSDLDGVQLFQLKEEWEPPALPTPSLNKLQPHMHCGHVLLLTYDSAGEIQHQLDELDSQSTANAFDQSALQSQVSMQQQNSATSPPDLDGIQLFQREQEWEPPALPTPSLNKLQPHMQCGHVLLPTYESAGGIQHQPDKLLQPAKKPKVGKKNSLTKKPPPSRKKPKVSGTFSDQTIKQINDVTSVSGVKSQEEEQMFSGPKRDSLVSEASQQIVQEEEDKLILEKIPLQQKLKKIVSKCGLKGYSNDVERCLSLCVEDRMRGLIGNLIRLSKQVKRLDVEKLMHRTVVTSDIGHQIMLLNRKAQDEWKTKQAEREKPQKHNEMHLSVANVAARSKWQQMAERAKRERGGINSGSGPQPRNTGQKMNTPKGIDQKTNTDVMNCHKWLPEMLTENRT